MIDYKVLKALTEANREFEDREFQEPGSVSPQERIWTLREALGLNQAQFAETVGYRRSTYCQFENGTKDMSKRFLDMVHKAYGINIEWILHGGYDIIEGRDPDDDDTDTGEVWRKRKETVRKREAKTMIDYLTEDELEIIYRLLVRLVKQ